MYAMKFDANRNFIWTEVPDPERKAGEVIIDIRAAGLNRADLLQCAGNYPPPPGWPEWPGLECAGVISQAGADSRWKVGDQVCALLGGGGYAQKVAVPEAMVLPVPRGFSMTQAAALPEVFATAWLNLIIEAGLKKDDRILIQAGASGLGIAAIQLAKAFGAEVITTVGNEQKEETVRKLGADIVINRKKEKISAVLAEHPIDIALDCVGGPALGECFDTMARGGRWILIATLAGTQTEISLRSVLSKGLRLIGSTLRSRSTEMKGRILADLESNLWPLFENKQMQPFIYRVLPMTEAAEAHSILERQENIGKVILEN
ncbi:MAG: NAD(P)H-quinone oxidoreductase [Lentisphaerae bacterium]|jgi:NADPH2:quinone reductase|nr:NAD(P)H-quinone oxidoreductase [Lentisphaerota bacterium]